MLLGIDATERVTLVGSSLVAGLLCWAPGERISAVGLWVAGGIVLLVHLVGRRAEGRRDVAPAAEVPTGAGEGEPAARDAA